MGRETRELLEACRDGNVHLVDSLIAARARRPRTPLSFLKAGSSSCWLAASRELSSGHTALHLAALHGHVRIAAALLAAAQAQDLPLLLTARDRRGNLPLHLAAFGGHLQIVKLLTDADATSATVNSENNARETGLHLAAQHGHLPALLVLLQHHADASPRNARGETALDLAARFGRTAVARALIAHSPALILAAASAPPSPLPSASSRGGSACGVSALHLAARNGHRDLAGVLLDSGADVDWLTEEGSALHAAAVFGQVDVVRLLLERGASTELRDWQGRSAVALLQEHLEHRAQAELTQMMQHKDAWQQCLRLIQDASGPETPSPKRLPSRSPHQSRRPPQVKFAPQPEELAPALPSSETTSDYRNVRSSSPVWHKLDGGLAEAAARRAQGKRQPLGGKNDGTLLADDIVFRPPPVRVPAQPIHRRSRPPDDEAPCLCDKEPLPSPAPSSTAPSSTLTSGSWDNPEQRSPKPRRPQAHLAQPQPCAYTALPPLKTPDWLRYDNVTSNLLGYDNAPQKDRGGKAGYDKSWQHQCEAALIDSLREVTPLADEPLKDSQRLLPPSPRLDSRSQTSSEASSRSPRPPSNPSPTLPRSPRLAPKPSSEVEVISDNTSVRSLNLVSEPQRGGETKPEEGRNFLEEALLSQSFPALGAAESEAPLALPEDDIGGSTTTVDSSPDAQRPNLRLKPVPRPRVSPPKDALREPSRHTNGHHREPEKHKPEPKPRSMNKTCNELQLMEASISEEQNERSTSREKPEGAASEPSDEPSSGSKASEASSPGSPPSRPSGLPEYPASLRSPTELPTPDTEPPSAADSLARISEAILPLSAALGRREGGTAAPTSPLPSQPSSVQDSREEWTQADGESSEEACSCDELDDEAVLDESAEWERINQLLGSFGGGMCRESVFSERFEPTVSEHLAPNGTLSSLGSLGPAAPVAEWLRRVPGVSDWRELAPKLVAEGYDAPEYLPSTLDPAVVQSYSPDSAKALQAFLDGAEGRFPTAGRPESHVFVSDWLLGLGCQDYLGNFMKAGLDSLDKVRNVEWSDGMLAEALGVPLAGHRRRLLGALGQREASTSSDSATPQPPDLSESSEDAAKAEDLALDPPLNLADPSEPAYPAAFTSPTLTTSVALGRPAKAPYADSLKNPGSRHSAPCSLPSSGTEETLVGSTASGGSSNSTSREDLKVEVEEVLEEGEEEAGPSAGGGEGGGHKWAHDPSALVHSSVAYPAHYLGSTLIPSLDDAGQGPKAALRKMKTNIKDIAKVPQVVLNISYKGVKVTGGAGQGSLTAHAIHNIHCVCQDERDLNCFAYITKDKSRHFSHVFSVLTADLATEIILTLGQAFEVAFQMATNKGPTPQAN